VTGPRKKPSEAEGLVTARSPKGLLTIKRSASVLETRQQIDNNIRNLRQFAGDLWEAAKNEKPTAGVLDLKTAAERVLKQLDMVQIYLNRIEHGYKQGRPPQPAAVLVLLDAALVLSSLMHHLTIIDNEVVIANAAAARVRLPAFSQRRSDRAQQKHRSLKARADEIRKLHHDWGDSRVARKMAKDDPTVIAKRTFDTLRRIIKN
jgi:hypothetical protein